MRFFKSLFLGILLLTFTANVCGADDSGSNIRLNVKQFTLKNGMLFLIVERPTAPQVACRIAIRAGSALEDTGKTGIAHLLEHMMFKGTKNFGTLDVRKDQELQERIEAAYQTILKEERKRSPNQKLIDEKLAEMNALRLEVQKIYVPQAFSSQLGRNGAVGVNAFTSKDQTQYTASVPSDMLEQWFSIISEQLFEPSWREFYVEKEVVQREWAFRYINSPQGAAWLDLNATAYNAHPYRNPTIGWKSDMEKYNTKDAISFHSRYYNPTNAVCVLVGDIKAEKARRLAETYFDRYPAGKRSPEQVTKESPQQGPRKSVRFLKGARTPIVMIGFHAAPMKTNDFYALDAMTMVLTSGRGARMTQNIVNKGLAIDAWSHNPDNRYGGMFIIGGSPNEPDELKNQTLSEKNRLAAYQKSCEELENLLFAELESLKTDLVSTRELDRIKKLNQRDFLDRLRSNEELAGTLATLEVQVGWNYLATYLDEIANIRPEDIAAAAKKYLRPENKTSVYIIPGGEVEQPPEHYTEVRSISGKAAATEEKPETFFNNSIYSTPDGWKHPLSFNREPKKIDYPPAETSTVEGATIFYLSDHELPLIDLSIFMKAGEVDLSDDKIGLTRLLNGCLIRGGTKSYSPSELAMVLDENAIYMSVSVREEETEINLSVMKEDWEKGLSLLEEILTRPRFDPSVFTVVKQQQMIALKRQGGDARTVCMREGKIRHFKGHPYGRDPLSALETILTLTPDDLNEFRKKYFVPANMVAAVSGDIAESEAIESLKKLFRKISHNQTPERNLTEPMRTPPVLALIHKPGQMQAQINLFLPGIRRTDPDYWKMSLLMDILGGNDSLMYTRLRDDLGLIYSGWFYQTYKWKAGILLGYIGCKGDKTGDAIRETAKIMTSLRKAVPEKEIEQKRLDALNSFVFNVDTPSELVEVYSNYHLRKEPLDTLEKIQDAFITATKKELETLAKKLLVQKKLQIFVVCDKTTLLKKSGGV